MIDPTNLWLTIHESVGHATEYDRAIGYEAAYAGTSFATPDLLGTLRYGSPRMHVTGDRTSRTVSPPSATTTTASRPRGGTWSATASSSATSSTATFAPRLGLPRSNGCAFADSPHHVPLQRMANVSLQPDPDGRPSTDDLIAGVDDGIYVVGDKSWSIDMQRYNFQFTGQRFFRIRDGRLAGQLRDVAYQSTTTDFWGSLEAVGGPSTWRLGGAMNCGKAQPGQIAPVSHGCPSALFRGVNVLNTRAEGVDEAPRRSSSGRWPAPVGAGRVVLVSETSRGGAALGQLHDDHERPHHRPAVAVVALEAVEGGVAAGVVSSAARCRTPPRSTTWSSPRERAARDAGPAPDVAPLPEPDADDPAWAAARPRRRSPCSAGSSTGWPTCSTARCATTASPPTSCPRLARHLDGRAPGGGCSPRDRSSST